MSDMPYGYCHCGCGGKTNIITESCASRGLVKGEPQRFIFRHGKKIDPILRFWSKVKKTEDCWEWQGYINNKGYGQFGAGSRKLIYSHRFSYLLHYKEIPDGLFVLHKCDNPKCVNPDHLFLGTQKDNMEDCKAKGRINPKSSQGETCHSAKLTNKDIMAIRGNSGLNTKELSTIYNVFPSTIRRIMRRTTWRHI